MYPVKPSMPHVPKDWNWPAICSTTSLSSPLRMTTMYCPSMTFARGLGGRSTARLSTGTCKHPKPNTANASRYITFRPQNFPLWKNMSDGNELEEKVRSK